MPPTATPGPVQDSACIREAVCVHTKKIFDSCRDKDCIEDLLVYPTLSSLPIIACALSVRARSAELLYVAVDVQPVSFNRGYFAVDARYHYKITGEACTPVCRNAEFTGYCVFDKRVILFGSEGNAKIFSSDTPMYSIGPHALEASNLPVAVVEAVDPIILNMKLVETCPPMPCESMIFDVPQFVAESFDSPVSFERPDRRVYVTLGQFSIIRLERDTQLLIPTYDYCIPEKECPGGNEDDPCSLFSRICFPMEEFFPPDSLVPTDGYREARATLGK
ncbi:MAG: hypothetical protein AB7C97_12065 [Oscillospiraceae bacterium]